MLLIETMLMAAPAGGGPIGEFGTLWMWGSNTGGKVPGGPTTPIYSWSAVSSRENFSLGIQSDGSLWSWGSNFSKVGYLQVLL